MSFKAIVEFNVEASSKYASSTQTFTGLWSYDFSSSGALMLNKRTSAEASDDLLVFPWRTIVEVNVIPEEAPEVEQPVQEPTEDTSETPEA